jgi:hypothetical protein
MAEHQPPKDDGDIKEDEIIRRLVPNASSPQVAPIRGFLLGNSDREEYWRLYLNIELTRFIEFRKEDTLHAKQFAPGRTVVWVKQGTKVQESQTRTAPVEFLQGEIRRGFFRGIPGVGRMLAMDASCNSGCAHCTASCTYPGPGSDTIGYTCGC